MRAAIPAPTKRLLKLWTGAEMDISARPIIMIAMMMRMATAPLYTISCTAPKNGACSAK